MRPRPAHPSRRTGSSSAERPRGPPRARTAAAQAPPPAAAAAAGPRAASPLTSPLQRPQKTGQRSRAGGKRPTTARSRYCRPATSASACCPSSESAGSLNGRGGRRGGGKPADHTRARRMPLLACQQHRCAGRSARAPKPARLRPPCGGMHQPVGCWSTFPALMPQPPDPSRPPPAPPPLQVRPLLRVLQAGAGQLLDRRGGGPQPGAAQQMELEAWDARAGSRGRALSRPPANPAHPLIRSPTPPPLRHPCAGHAGLGAAERGRAPLCVVRARLFCGQRWHRPGKPVHPLHAGWVAGRPGGRRGRCHRLGGRALAWAAGLHLASACTRARAACTRAPPGDCTPSLPWRSFERGPSNPAG